jgi:1,4-dihydroxy-2-naphthoate octaprenyltransferase
LTDSAAVTAPARWWQALTPAIYLVSILPGVGVWQLLRPTGEALLTLVIATVAVVLVQHAVNVLNDLADWRLGADAEKWNSWVRVHREDLAVVGRHGWLSLLAGGVLGILALARSDRLWVLAFALPLVGLGLLYNAGKRPLSYTWLGEWVTGLCYGPGVFGGLWLVTGHDLDLSALPGSLAFGSLAVALLLSHQPPQMHTDRLAGKRSFAARYGKVRTYRTARILLLAFLATWGLALASRAAPGVTLALYVLLSCLVVAGSFGRSFGPRYVLLSASALFAILAVAPS